MLDTILRGGAVVDGSGAEPVTADVGLRRGTIEFIGSLADAQAATDIDVTGNVVLPGLVDVHTHSDLAAFLPQEQEAVKLASVRQGVTTEIVGNCGWSPFPSTPETSQSIREHVSSVFGPAARSFERLADYREAMSGQLLPTHIAPLVGHGTIRAAVLGLGRVAADATGTASMCDVLERCLDDGAFGLSSGLVYPPGVYSGGEELVALARVLRMRGGIYTTHVRNEMDGVLGAVAEGIEVGRHAGVPVQISHVKVAGREQWGMIDAVLELVDRSARGGVDVRGDVYPYTAGSTLLRALLPPWVNEGGVPAMLGRLADGEIRRRVAEQYLTGVPGWQNFVAAAGWENIVVAAAPGRPDLEGRSIADHASSLGTTPAETAAQLLLALRGEVVVVLHMMAENDVRTLLGHPDMLIGSDTIPLPGTPHPRTAGTFARVLGRYVREGRICDLPAMVRRMTDLPARRFRLGRRGRLTPGYAADLVVIDADRIIDHATYEEPLRPAAGVRHVFVAGRPVVLGGSDTGARPGRVLEPA